MRWLDVLRRWMWSDRIRASPREGKLLRLPVGACVRIGGTVAEVAARTVVEGDAGAREVCYACRSATGDFQLYVLLDSAMPTVRLRMGQHNPACDVLAHEIETFG